MITLQNDYLTIGIDESTGAIQQISHRGRDLELIAAASSAPPWRIEVDDQVWIDEFTEFSFSRTDDGVDLHWTATNGLAVDAAVRLGTDERYAGFSIAVGGHEGVIVDKIEYPVLAGIGDLGHGVDSYLAHPQGTGFLFRNPAQLFTSDKPGLRYSPYPEGFSGSSTQFMTYYADRIGGFSLATHDPSGAMKWLNFWKHEDGHLRSTFMHQSPNVRSGNGYAVPYEVLIGTLDTGTWYEAADRYKAWAVDQSWTRRGLLADRAGWLQNETGFATFGINSSHDRAAWLDRFHRITGKPVFHILGVNWPRHGGNYGNFHPGGRADWFPAQFDEANLATIRRNGDYWAPFEFDLLQNPDGIEREQIEPALVTFQDEKYSFDAYHFPFHCPVTPYQRELHAWRDAKLAGEYGADALYYDISANNVAMQCRSTTHGHPVGGGEWMVDSYRTMWAETGGAASAAKGEHVPQGAEMVNEVFLASLDFYQARAEATPLAPFESGFFRDWIIAGDCEKIPLFTYIYHEYGPVRLDGWGKLSVETGPLWYWVAARVALWGGLYELNYEFSPLEVLDGQMEDVTEHYATLDPVEFEIDPAKEAFVREIANARTGFAQPYLVFGTMRPPLRLDLPEIDLDWYFYNFNPKSEIYGQRGTQRVPVVQHAAWMSPDGTLGFVFVNLHESEVQTVPLAIDLAGYGLDWASVDIVRTTSAERHVMFSGDASAGLEFSLELAPRTVTLVEVAAIDGHA
jgi:hypothetical protein